MAAKTVDEYITGLDEWKGAVVAKCREIVRDSVPDVEEAIKWAQPVFSSNGPFCYIKAFKNSVNFGFWRGVDLDDPKRLLKGTGEKMRHVPLKSVDDIDVDALSALVRQAVQLNLSKGDPTKGD